MIKNLDIKTFGGDLELSWRWRSRSTWVLTLVGMFWNIFMGLFLVVMLLAPDVEWAPFLAVAAFELIGIGLAYTALAGWFNKTRITANRRELSVAHGPIPWPGNKTILRWEIEQLFVAHAGRETVNGKATELYALRAKTKNGKVHTLARGLRGKGRALEIERRLENHLGIEDVAIIDNPLEEMLKKHLPGLELPPIPGAVNDGKPGATGGTELMNETAAPRRRNFADDDPLEQAIGSTLQLRDLEYEITDRVQLDWYNGTSDRSVGLRGGSEPIRIYAEDRGPRGFNYLEERELSPKEFLRLGLAATDDLPASFVNGDEKYFQREDIPGYRHTSEGGAAAVHQWIYFTTTSHVRFRVIESGGVRRVFIQDPIEQKVLMKA